jgi:hypothetical protein
MTVTADDVHIYVLRHNEFKAAIVPLVRVTGPERNVVFMNGITEHQSAW